MADSKPKAGSGRRSKAGKGSGRKPSRLGRGLSTLMAHPVQITPPPTEAMSPMATPGPRSADGPRDAKERDSVDGESTAVLNGSGRGLSYIPVGSIRANPHQPRQIFDEQALARLAESIGRDGLMQPIIVRPVAGASDLDAVMPHDGQSATHSGQSAYELVAGERRLRAAQLAGLAVLPAIVRTLDERQLAEWALIENLQREDLNPIERAKAFEHLANHYQLSHDEIANRVGVERSTVSNCLRLLGLCDPVRSLIMDGLLSAGQAKALAGIIDPNEQQVLARQAVAQGWSVRQMEYQARRVIASGQKYAPVQNKPKAINSAYLSDLEQQVGRQLQTKVKIRSGRKKGTGTLCVEFYSLDQFDALMQRLNVQVQMD